MNFTSKVFSVPLSRVGNGHQPEENLPPIQPVIRLVNVEELVTCRFHKEKSTLVHFFIVTLRD